MALSPEQMKQLEDLLKAAGVPGATSEGYLGNGWANGVLGQLAQGQQSSGINLNSVMPQPTAAPTGSNPWGAIDMSKMVDANGRSWADYVAATKAQAGAPAGAQVTRTPNQVDALMGAEVQHQGWNPGEAGPPGSPDFVRMPKTEADWRARYAWFNEGENWKMLDPKWRPVNMWYQKDDPKAVAYLQDLAAGRVPKDQVAWDWEDPQKAYRQLQAWGKIPSGTGASTSAYVPPTTTTPPEEPVTPGPLSKETQKLQNANPNGPAWVGPEGTTDYFQKAQQAQATQDKLAEWYKAKYGIYPFGPKPGSGSSSGGGKGGIG